MTVLDSILRKVTSLAPLNRNSAVALAGCAGLGLLSGLATLGSDIDETSLSDSWTLSEPPRIALASEVDTMLAAPLFGGEPVIVASEQPVEPVEISNEGDPWSLTGLVFEGMDRFAVVRNKTTDRLQYVTPGGSLPGGEILVEIRPNSILYETQDDVVELALFRDIRNAEE
jgi:hypothetical protein